MPQNKADIPDGCVILPFARNSATELKATTLAALVAVTIVHDKNISAEEQLIEIIEASGEAEVLDTEDALSDLGLESEVAEAKGGGLPQPVNDNAAMTVV